MLIGTVQKYPTRADAERAVEHLRVTINQQNLQSQFHSATVGGLIDRFVQEELPNGRRFQTRAEYRTYFNRYIRPQWGNLLLKDVEPMRVLEWLKALPLAPKTKGHIRNAMHLLFQWARRWKMIDINPIGLVRQSNRRLNAPRVLSPQEFQALLFDLRDPYRTMVAVSACLGLRASEVMGLKWGDVDWDNMKILVRRSVVAGRVDETKTEASAKPLPLDPDLATALLDWRRKAPYTGETDFVFAGDAGKPRWQGMILKDYIQRAAVNAGIGKVGWHTFRHSYRAWLKRFAAPVEIQKELMRHSNLKTTLEIYGIEPDVAPAHRQANSAVVTMLLGKSTK
ncbi:MAG: site-specific integrase [Acidobacteriota bacterium]|nr:site-specific integrase [Acidobacteriota bacterium]